MLREHDPMSPGKCEGCGAIKVLRTHTMGPLRLDLCVHCKYDPYITMLAAHR